MDSLNISNIQHERMKTLFSVLIVSTVLTIYEILMFYVFMIPEIKKQIDSGIIQLSLFCKNYINSINNDILNTNEIQPFILSINKTNYTSFVYESIDITKYNFISIFKTYEQRESILIYKLNTYNLFTSCFLLFILFFSIFSIMYYFRKKDQTIIDKYIWISIITIFFILLFQYIFFIYASNYNYIGSQNEIEIIYFIMSIL